ncbi:hypothetical protein KC362_g18415, partial [Hortaea werneckii]
MAAPREELIQGAVTFLQDPSVASAPYEQKLSFLRSKNLTQDEIDASLARVGQAPSPSDPSSSYPPQCSPLPIPVFPVITSYSITKHQDLFLTPL